MDDQIRKGLGYLFLVMTAFAFLGLLRYGSEIESDLDYYIGWLGVLGFGHITMKHWLRWY